MRRLLRAALAATLPLAAVVVATAPATSAQAFTLNWAGSAKSTYCVGSSGSRCLSWTGKVVSIGDGDTIRVDLAGDGSTASDSVRITGIQAMEQYVYSSVVGNRRGECHALEATARLNQLIPVGSTIILKAAHTSSSSLGRPLRSVLYRSGGAWHDLGQRMLSEGHALAALRPEEPYLNQTYRLTAQQAAARHLNMWDPNHCGVGPAATLKMWVNWDGDGDESRNINAEWVRIRNDADTDVSLAGWWFRDSALRGTHGRGYVFPAGTTIRAHGAITLYAGSGSNTATSYFWGLASTPFENVSNYPAYEGEGGYLFDPQGDLRESMVWPCLVSCSDPLIGVVRISNANYSGYDEWVDLHNDSGSAVDLDGYVVQNLPYIYAFRGTTMLAGNGTLRLYVNGSPDSDSATVKHWGKPNGQTIFDNAGDVIRVRTQTNISVSCARWGSGNC